MQPLNLSASRLPLATICPASTIPALHPVATTSPEATLGTALHHMIGCAVVGQHLEASHVAQQFGLDAEELEILARCAWRVWEQLRERFPSPLIEEPLELSQASGPTLKGRVDLLSLIHEANAPLSWWAPDLPTEARVLDWKSNRDTETDYAAQLKGYAYLACRRWPSVRRVYTVVAWVRDQSWDAQYHEREQLERWWMDFGRSLEREPLPANPGLHCRYCARQLECPQKARLLQQAAECLLTPGEPILDQVLAAPGRGRIYQDVLGRLKLLEQLMEATRAAIRADVAAAGGSLPAGEGYELRLVEQRRTIIAKEAWSDLVHAIGLDAALDCVTVHKTKVEQAIREQVPEDAPRGARKEAVDVWRRQLEEAGAIGVKTVERLELKRITEKLETA